MTDLQITTKPGAKYRSIKNPRVYEALRDKGYTKAQAARISNAQARRRRHKAYTLDQLESYVLSPCYDPRIAQAIADRVPALPRLKGEQLAPGITRIRGNLCNVHGKYGKCPGAEVAPAKGTKPKGGKGGGRGRKPAKTEAEKRQARDAARQERAQEREQQRQQNVDQTLGAIGMQDEPASTLLSLAAGEGGAGDDFGLIQQGLVERDTDGNLRLSANGRAFYHASERGDLGAARDALSRGRDNVAHGTARAQAQQERKRAAEQRKQEVAQRRAEAQAKREQAQKLRAARLAKQGKRSASGGGTQSSSSSAATDRATQREQAAQSTAQQVGIGGEGLAALRSAAEAGGVQNAELESLGLIQNGETTDQGRRALSALERGDVRQYRAAVQDARARLERAAQQPAQRVAGADGVQHRNASTAARAEDRRNGVKRRRKAYKAQTPQERAMFANMGSSGSGGGGGGSGGSAKPTGGTGGLWKKGPGGKRTPQAGFEGGKRSPSTGEGKPRASDPGKPARGQTVGNSTKAYGTDPNKSYTMRHELVDMGDIQASNTAGGGINPHYDAALQPRDRTRASSQAQIAGVAQHMNPEVLTTDFHRIDAGSPIIDKQGNVLSGNGRTLALQRAAEMHPDKYAEYKAQIKAQAREAGIDPAAVDKMKHPVLVRRLEGDTDTVTFAREANSSGTLRMSPLEQAKVDAGQISDRHMLKLQVTEHGDIDRALRDKANKPFVDEFLASVPENERANLLTRNGDLNQMGLYRAKAAVYTRAFPGQAGERMAESMLESLDPDVKTIQNGISGALPAFSRATSLARSGLRERDLDISHDIAQTIDVYARIKDNPSLTHNTPASQVVAKYLGQSSMFDRELNADQERLLVHIDKISRKPTEVRSFFERYAQLVEQSPQPGQSSLFGSADRMTRSQLFDALLGSTAMPEIQSQGAMFS